MNVYKKSFTILFLLGLLFFSAYCGAKQEQQKELSLMTWEGYVTDELLAAFEKQTGIKVKVTNISDNNEIISKLRATDGEGYDVVQPSWNNMIDAQKNYKIYMPLDLARINILDNIIPSLRKTVLTGAVVDGKNIAIPYVWGTSGLIVNTEKVKQDSYSFMDLYDPAHCGRTTSRYRFPTFVGAGYALGNDYFGAYGDEEEYRKMTANILKFLISKKKCIRTYWTTRQEHIDLMKSGETHISQGWDGTGWLLSEKYPHIKFIAPKEGALGWIDVLALSAGAENVDEAYKWINFVMTAEWSGQVSSRGGFLSVVKGATDALSPERKRLIEESFPTQALENIKWYPPEPAHVVELKSQSEERLKAGQ